jgi:4-aminobutyrate aminotransferase/(S)-3-amino-2-methylpropionate transaminase
MGVAGSLGTRRKFGVPVPGGIMAPYAYCYRCFYEKTYPECKFFCIRVLDRIIQSSSSGDLGAVILEPYQGSAGFIFPPDGWLKALEEWARERNLVMIVDEVQSSFGRTGKLYAIEWEDLRPQMLCLGKGMGSGVPASAVAAESRIFDCMGTGELSSTWGGNPLASAATIAVLEAMEEGNLPERARRMGEYMLPRLREIKKKYRCLGDVRGKGLVIGLEFVDPADGYTPSPEITSKVVMGCAELGILLGKVGLYGNVIRVAPPLVILPPELDIAVETFERVIGKVEKSF